MTVATPESKIVVIDTDTYAMHFHEDMCAYITGQVGELGVGYSTAGDVEGDLRNLAWYQENIVQEEDDRGYRRPAAIWPTPGRFFDGDIGHYDDTPEVRATLEGSRATSRLPAEESVAIFVNVLPPDEVLAEMIERAQTYCDQHGFKYLGCRMLEPQYTVKQVPVHVGHLEVLRKVAQNISAEEIHLKLPSSA